MRTILILVFSLSFLTTSYSQELNLDNSTEILRDSTEFDWYRAPSIRWNATGLFNFFAPSASFVFEYPFSKRLGIEVETGPLLPYSQATFEGEKFNGFRFRAGPKVYMAFDDDELFYLRVAYKYDNANISTFKRVLDPSGSFAEDKLVGGKFVNRGWLLYTGLMTDLNLGHNFVFDISFGLGWTRWNEELTIPDGTSIIEERALFQIDRTDGAGPVVSVNMQLGYRF